ncbi:MAG: AraC family transcriptional regulator [Monoglobales bacterium]
MKYNLQLCEIANRTKLNILNFGHAVVSTDWSGRVYLPVFSRIYYIIKGSFYITADNGKEIKLEAGKWYLIPAGISFSFSCSEIMEHIYFHIKLCNFDDIDLLLNCTEAVYNMDFENKSKRLIDMLNDKSFLAGLEIRQILYDVLVLMIKKYDIDLKSIEYSPCILRALKYIKQHLSTNLTISDIAENFFVSKSTLTKHFRKELSMSVNEYVNNLIMTESAKILLTSNVTIMEISEKFNFSDQFYFSKCFKKTFGKSPREYRKSINI